MDLEQNRKTYINLFIVFHLSVLEKKVIIDCLVPMFFPDLVGAFEKLASDALLCWSAILVSPSD